MPGNPNYNPNPSHVHHLEPITKTPFNLPAVITDGRYSDLHVMGGTLTSMSLTPILTGILAVFQTLVPTLTVILADLQTLTLTSRGAVPPRFPALALPTLPSFRLPSPLLASPAPASALLELY